MSSKYLIEENLKRVNSRARRLRFLQHSSTLGAIVTLLFLLLAGVLIGGWTAHPLLVRALIVILILTAAIAWMVIGLSLLSSEPRRQWLASLLERGQPQLLDRLNTMVFLERSARRDPLVRSFYLRIARQAQAVLLQKPPSVPLSRARPLVHFAAFVTVLVLTMWVYERYSPWERFMAARQHTLSEQAGSKVTPPEAPLELALPTNNLAEQHQSWGEVRITEPARDLQVTKVDVVPLQIEAAANEKLQKVGWSSTINGADEKPHELPPPPDPRFAVYQPMLYLDELRLSDWDVLTYYAKANTEQDNSYASEVYFLEVRPFREDILKIPGGEGGQAYQCLNELTALISQQQHVIRQTHQHMQRPPDQPHLQAQDRSKLADAEKDLSQSANHLYAKMATEMENRPIGEALDQLAKAEKELDRASASLRDDAMTEAQNRERSALAELIATRKAFQRAVSENPKAFEEQKEDEPPPPIAEELNKLKEIAEFRNEAKAAQDFIRDTLAKQRDVARRATNSRTYSSLAAEEQNLQTSLETFESLHPKPFQDVKTEMGDCKQAMSKAEESLQKRSTAGSRTNLQAAVKELQKLGEAMKNQSSDQQLADAYKLKQMLDKQIESMSQCQKSGDGMSGEAMQKTAAETRETLKQLKSTAEQSPTRDAFGPELRESLSDLKMVSLNWPLSELEQAQDGEARKQAAGKAKGELSKVSKAFEESQPEALQAAQKHDSLKPAEQESLERGLAQLESLLKQVENQKPASKQDQAKQGQEALYNLQTGLRNQYGSNERGNQIMVQLERELKPGETPDVGNIRKLMDELQKFSLELTSQQARKEEKPEVTNIDPTRLPPAYRGRIEKYFQKLSEK